MYPGSYQNWLVVELSRSIPPLDTRELKYVDFGFTNFSPKREK
jgi:hypothetical protein